MMKTHEKDVPIAAQLVGREPDIMLGAAEKILQEVNITFLDINAACPAKKVLKKRSGAYLLRDETALYRIISRLAGSFPVPVTVKLRIGYDDKSGTDIAGIARRCEESGASAIFVHGRTRIQGYSGVVDYEAIKAVKQSVAIPVFGSGDVFSSELAQRMLSMAGCDGILVARGALGNPWIFEDIDHYMKNGSARPRPDIRTIKKTLKRHLAYIEEHNGSKGKMGVMRKNSLWYLKHIPNARRIRAEICTVANTYEKMISFIDAIQEERDEIPYGVSGLQY
jgi:nifR3 family TIM-barrel protein